MLAPGGELTGKPLETTLVHAPRRLKAACLLLVGAGKREKFAPAVLRKIAGAALRYLKSRSVKQFPFLLREKESVESATQAVAEGALTANFESDKYKTEKKDAKSVDSIILTGFAEQDRAAVEKGLARGVVIADSQNFARDLINEPSNKLTPKALPEKAAAMPKEPGLSLEILAQEPKPCLAAARKSPATSSPPCPAKPSRCSTPTPRAASFSPTASTTPSS